MRTKLLTFIATLIASVGATMVQAQQDVTSQYLANPGFDTAPLTFLAEGKNPDAERLYGTGWVYSLPSWTSECVVNANAVQIASAVYGYSGAANEGLNGVLPPTEDKNGASAGASIHMSAGWGDKAIITQIVSGLPAGKYRLSYDAYNANTVATITSNYFGFVPGTGVATYGSKKSYTTATWETETVDFIIATDGGGGKISIGCTTSSGGSASGAKLYVDNVKLFYLGIDKTDLASKITEAEALYGNGSGTKASDLNAAIVSAKAVNVNASATMIEVANAITSLTAAIRAYGIYNAENNDVTFLLANPDFNDGTAGWITNMGIWGATSGQNTMYTGALTDPNPVLDKGGSGHIYGYQTFENLPAGAYMLEAIARGQTTGGLMQIFINNGSDENNTNGTDEKTVAVNRVGDTGGPLEFGFASYSTDVLMLTSGGTITLGVRVENGTVSAWQSADAFRLYCYTDMAAYYPSLIKKLKEDLNVYDLSLIPSGCIKDIEAAILFSEETAGSSDLEVLKGVVDSLTHAYDRAKAAEPVMARFILAAEAAMIYVDLGYNGKEALNTAIDAAFALMAAGAELEDGSFVYAKDLENGIAVLNAATRTYRFNEPIVDAEAGVDFTWTIQSPNFTKAGGDPSVVADATSTGWIRDNVFVTSDFKLININGKNCWNNWSNNFTSMNVYQVLEGLPAGYYTFECLQTNNGPEVTDQHAYITALGGTVNSSYATYTQVNDPNTTGFANAAWEELKTGKVLVGKDGKLQIGMASTSNKNGSSGWFCMTGCVLKYYGPGSYADGMLNLIQEAEELNNSEMLKSDHKDLADAIEVAKAVNTADAEIAEAGMVALNGAMKNATDAAKTLLSFKKASYANVKAVADNMDMLYSDELSALMGKEILAIDATLDKDTTTLAVYPVLTAELNRYIAFKDAYQACYTYVDGGGAEALIALFDVVLPTQVAIVNGDAGKLVESTGLLGQYLGFARAYTACATLKDEIKYTELQPLFDPLLSAQLQAVIADVANIPAARKQFDVFTSFCDTYSVAIDIANMEEPIYDENKVVALVNECVKQFAIVEVDYTKASEAAVEINKLLADLRLEGITAGDNTEITSSVIVNPTVNNTANTALPEGWRVEKTVTNYTYNGGHWSGAASNYFFDANGTVAMKYTAKQTIAGLHNGTYKLMAAARASGAGGYVFAQVEDGVKKSEIIVNSNVGGSIWENAKEGTAEKFANGGKGGGWNWVEIANINVNTNTMTIGCSCDPAVLGAGTPWAGGWFSVDDFKLFWVSNDFFGVGVEELEEDAAASFTAYAENGYIVVEGAEEYAIFTIDGVALPLNAQLAPGIYVVKSGAESVKVSVQ